MDEPGSAPFRVMLTARRAQQEQETVDFQKRQVPRTKSQEVVYVKDQGNRARGSQPSLGSIQGLEITGSRPSSSSKKQESSGTSFKTDLQSIRNAVHALSNASLTTALESTSSSPRTSMTLQKEKDSKKKYTRSGSLKTEDVRILSLKSDKVRARFGSLGSISTLTPSKPKKVPRKSKTEEESKTTTPEPEMIPVKPDETFTSQKYKTTPYQQEIYSVLCPALDEHESNSFKHYDGPPYTATQAYRCQHYFHFGDLARVVNKVISSYRVLRTRFYRNEKIVDADVDGILESQHYKSMAPNTFLDVFDPFQQKGIDLDDALKLSLFAQSWMVNVNVKRPFTILLIRSIFEDPSRLADNFLVFGGSLLVSDETSMTLIAKDILLLYKDCHAIRSTGRSEEDIDIAIDAYKIQESESFSDYAFDCKRTKSDTGFWKTQCIEVTQEIVDVYERKDLEGQLRRISNEKDTLSVSVASLAKRKSELEQELKVLRSQRREIDRGENGEGQITTFTDSVSGEVIQITQEAKAALIKTVLGEDAATDNIVRLLDKHEVPKEVQRKLNASYMSVETFANITEVQIEPLGLMTKDKRQILALSDYVRNRIKDCLHEQTKVKYSLERRIGKLARELEGSTDNLKHSQNALESNDDLSIRLTAILKPPYVETKIPALNLNEHADGLYKGGFGKDGYADLYDFVPVTISDETLENMRAFRNSWNISLQIKKKKADEVEGDNSSDNESLLASDDPEDEPGRDKRKVKSVDVVCLAAFGVLMKHITGQGKFLIGLTQSYRRNGAYIGPLTDTVPVKLDLSKRGLAFDGLFAQLMKTCKNLKRHGSGCPLPYILRENGVESPLNVRFEFISLSESREWLRRGLSPDDLLQSNRPTFFQKDGFTTERLWAVNEKDSYDVKLIMIEGPNGLQGGLKYRKGRFDDEKMYKWGAKLGALFECIEYTPRKMRVSAMISRFYNNVWQGSNSNLINGSSMSLYSVLGSSQSLTQD